jgi:hypothetical protein
MVPKMVQCLLTMLLTSSLKLTNVKLRILPHTSKKKSHLWSISAEGTPTEDFDFEINLCEFNLMSTQSINLVRSPAANQFQLNLSILIGFLQAVIQYWFDRL